MAAAGWTTIDRLRASKDRRAKLLLSLDGGGGAPCRSSLRTTCASLPGTPRPLVSCWAEEAPRV